MRYVTLLLGSIAALLALGGTGEAADPRATDLIYEPWSKTCLTQASCFVSAVARGQCSPSGGSISVSPQNNKRAILSANVATRTMLEGTISLRIDQDEPIQLAKPHCYTLGCGGTLEADGEFIQRLKHAQSISMEAKSLTGQSISLSFPLTHFSETFDGPGSEPKVFEGSQHDLKQLLQQRPDSFKQLPQCDD